MFNPFYKCASLVESVTTFGMFSIKRDVTNFDQLQQRINAENPTMIHDFFHRPYQMLIWNLTLTPPSSLVHSFCRERIDKYLQLLQLSDHMCELVKYELRTRLSTPRLYEPLEELDTSICIARKAAYVSIFTYIRDGKWLQKSETFQFDDNLTKHIRQFL